VVHEHLPERPSFSALQRAEIAEIVFVNTTNSTTNGFSALQRAEIAEIVVLALTVERAADRFSALQRAEIAEIQRRALVAFWQRNVSVLFNEPKLLKSSYQRLDNRLHDVSVLFNEPKLLKSSHLW